MPPKFRANHLSPRKQSFLTTLITLVNVFFNNTRTIQWILAYPNFGYPNTSIIRTPNVTVLLEYFAISVHSIRVNDCSIRVVQRSSVYKSMGFSYPNKFTYLNTFGKL